MLFRSVSRRIEFGLRESDTAARLGGDEFALMLTSTTPEDALAVAERVVEALREPFVIGMASVSTRASIGVALSCLATRADAAQLVRNADLAMYVAKREGKGPRLFDPAMHEALVERTKLLADLHTALAQGSLAVHYQPIFRSEERALVGAEALVRWSHPTRGMVSPALFIPVAEEAGLVGEVGRFVLARSLADLASWRAAGAVDDSFTLRVNISARELEDDAFVAHVARALYASGVPASALVVEVTETVLTNDVAGMAMRLGGLKALGVRIAIDDFGSGYASYSYLHQLPVDELKIDRVFIASMTTERGSRAIVRSMIVLAHDLGLEVVSEGVEDEATLAALTALGSELVQGYLLARPSSAADLLALLDTKREERLGRESAGEHAKAEQHHDRVAPGHRPTPRLLWQPAVQHAGDRREQELPAH